MKTVEFFSGTKSFSKVAKELGHDTFTIDIDASLSPDLCIDILDFNLGMLPYIPDVVWFSPPCTTFSVASIRHYWVNGKPKNDKCLNGIALVKKTLQIRDQLLKLNPDLIWFIENPRGMLRKQDFMFNQGIRETVTYCQYGSDIQKPTDIWTNAINWLPRKPCKAGSPCHQRASRGSRSGTQGIIKNQFFNHNRSALARGVIPQALFYEIFNSLGGVPTK